jgi:hypothetical protein
MIFISHRGNIENKNVDLENNPTYIDNALHKGYDVEVDVWMIDGKLYLGHDTPQYDVTVGWVVDRINNLWVHCKNIESLIYFKNCGHHINFFWHQEDDVTLTSKGHIWAYPGKQPIKDSIAVMPEINNDDLTKCIGICSDVISNYL